MEYTLDSVHHTIDCLKEVYPDYKIIRKSVILAGKDLEKLEEKDLRFFFGVLTVSDNVQAELTYQEKTVIQVESGSQINAIVFTNAEFTDLENNPIEPEGLFRGFEINVQSL